MSDDFLSPPPFQAATTLQRLERELRDLGLSPRAGAWEWKGSPVLKLALDGGALQAALVERPARSPQWQAQRLTDQADVRRWLERVRTSMRGWRPDD